MKLNCSEVKFSRKEVFKFFFKEIKLLKNAGIDPATSRMLSVNFIYCNK